MSNTYKELDRPYVAKQLNGPVITAFIKAVYNFFHKDIDDHAAYFRNLSIDTADTEHLYFIGKLMGLQLFSLFVDSGGGVYITYTESEYDTEYYDYNNGWSSDYSEHVEGDEKGVFGTGEEKDFPVILTDEQYKNILTAMSKISSAAVDSILAIDTLTKNFLDSTDYTVSYNNGFKDIINIQLGDTVHILKVQTLQNMFNNLLAGASVSVLVSHI